MTQTTVLNIDDSATIRRMVDSHLSQAGYRVVLAPTAEEGLVLAPQVKPDLILLDHQLPGTTGLEFLQKLLQMPECAQTPVVVASTLRARAYAEYMDIPNVVDSLHKPFTAELLKTTVANALEIGAMVIKSQAGGTAVPEVMQAQSEAALSGTLKCFNLREVADFLNNGNKKGLLEIEADHDRTWFFLDRGRIQAVVANGVAPEVVSEHMPDKLQDLAPLLKFTIGGEFSSQVDGLVELLNKKVLDPRMLRTLLRYQAAKLTWRCFTGNVKCFTFEAQRDVPALFRKIPLDISLAALAVEAALACPDQQLPSINPQDRYVRRGLRGQNLDRSGLSAQHMKVLGALGEPTGLDELSQQTGLALDEVRRVLCGFLLAEWVQDAPGAKTRYVVALETDRMGAPRLRDLLSREGAMFRGKVVRDRLGIQLLLKRNHPDVVMIAIDSNENCELTNLLRAAKELQGTKFVGIVSGAGDGNEHVQSMELDAELVRPYIEQDVAAVLDGLFESDAAAESASVHGAGGTGAPEALQPAGAGS